ncbi:MAG: Fic family protein, partial [Chlamydiae bacterium]|nr:Fic family protein [Chlamydiota bacterium]
MLFDINKNYSMQTAQNIYLQIPNSDQFLSTRIDPLFDFDCVNSFEEKAISTNSTEEYTGEKALLSEEDLGLKKYSPNSFSIEKKYTLVPSSYYSKPQISSVKTYEEVENIRKAVAEMYYTLEFDEPAESIEKKLLWCHKTLFKELPDSSQSGLYRTDNTFVFNNMNRCQQKGIANEILISGGNAADIQTFINFQIKYASAQAKKLNCPYPDKKEAAVINIIGYLPPPHFKVEPLMTQFIQELRERYIELKPNDNTAVIRLAAFAHTTIREIHPFVDGNGRLARMVMNAILMHKGLQPMSSYDSYANYFIAVRQSSTQDYTSFANYLEGRLFSITATSSQK